MPCRVDNPPPTVKYVENPQQKKDLEITTRLACRYCRKLELSQKPIPEWASEWWQKHKKRDETAVEDKKWAVLHGSLSVEDLSREELIYLAFGCEVDP